MEDGAVAAYMRSEIHSMSKTTKGQRLSPNSGMQQMLWGDRISEVVVFSALPKIQISRDAHTGKTKVVVGAGTN